MTTLEALASAVDIWNDPRRTVPVIKGRVALYAILRTLDLRPGDEVVMPGFTCIVVPAAVIYAGAKPIYHDIDPDTLQGAPDLAAAAITPRTRAVLLQHNFGQVAPSGDLPAKCEAAGIALIEDCAHAMGASIDGRPVGTLGTASFCSLQWSKPTTTGLGGIARFNREADVARCHDLVRREFREPPAVKAAYLGILSLLFRQCYRPSWYWTAQDLYRWAGRRGFIQGSSSDEELVSGVMPPGYLERFGNLRSGSLHSSLSSLPRLLAHRRRIHDEYSRALANQGIWQPPPAPRGRIDVALRYPLLVENRQVILERARTEKIEIGDWFNAPLHPEGARPEAFGYHPGCCPVAEAAASRVINLPTHRHVTSATVARTLAFLDRHAVFTQPSS